MHINSSYPLINIGVAHVNLANIYDYSQVLIHFKNLFKDRKNKLFKGRHPSV